MFNTILLSLTVALWGCGGSGDDPEPDAPTITTSMEAINAPATGGNYTINVTTTGKEWGVYTEGDFVKVTANYTSNSVSVTVDENPNTSTRTGNVVIMSGIARKSISFKFVLPHQRIALRGIVGRLFGSGLSDTDAFTGNTRHDDHITCSLRGIGILVDNDRY